MQIQSNPTLQTPNKNVNFKAKFFDPSQHRTAFNALNMLDQGYHGQQRPIPLISFFDGFADMYKQIIKDAMVKRGMIKVDLESGEMSGFDNLYPDKAEKELLIAKEEAISRTLMRLADKHGFGEAQVHPELAASKLDMVNTAVNIVKGAKPANYDQLMADAERVQEIISREKIQAMDNFFA